MPEEKNSAAVEFRTLSSFCFFVSTELECERQECETLARLVIDRGLATLVMMEKSVYQTRVYHRDIQTQIRELKIRRAEEYF